MAQPFVLSAKMTLDGAGVVQSAGAIRQEFGKIGMELDAVGQKAASFQTSINSRIGIQDNVGLNRAADIEAYGRQMDELRAKYNPLFALEQRRAANLAGIARAQQLGAISAKEMAAAIRAEEAAFTRSVAAINNSTEALERNRATAANQNGGQQFATANVAAQFQDIAVTSAMGMSPLQIALQQGTQISAAFGNMGAAGAVKTLGAAFMSIVSPVSLVTIGLVAGTAAAIQFFAGMAGGSEQAAAALEEHEKWLDQVLVGYDDVREKAQEAADQALRLPSASVALELGGNRDAKRDELQRQLQSIYNTPIDIIVGIQPQLADELGEIQQLVDNLAAGKIDLGEFDTGLRLIKFSEEPATRVRAMVDQLLAGSDAALMLQSSLEGATAAARAMTLDGFMSGTFSQLTGAADAIEALKPMTPDLRSARERAQSIYDANSGSDVSGELQRQLDYTLSQIDAQEAEQEAKRTARTAKTVSAYDRQIKTIRERTAAQQSETTVIGLGTYATERARMVLELENAAREDSIGLSAGRAAQIQEEASAYAMAAAAQEKAVDAQRLADEQLEFGRGTFRSFIMDLKQGLKEGEDGWAALGNAGANALDRIADRALGMMADGIFDAIFGSIMGGITGGFGGNPLNLGAGGAGFLGGGAASWGMFDTGGWTGGVAGQARGIVHGEEFVVRAGPAAQHRALLETINAGGSPSAQGGSTYAPVYNIDARGSNITRREFEAALDARDRKNAAALPAMLADARHRASRGAG